MKVFYGGIFIERETLLKSGIHHPIKLEYYKTVNEELNIYGIDIIKTEYKTSDIITEEKEIKYLSNDETKIEKILKLLKNNAVTPVAAQDVADDLLKQAL